MMPTHVSGEPLATRVRDRLTSRAGAVLEHGDASLVTAVRDEIGLRSVGDVLRAAELVRGDLIGAGALEPLLREPGVTDVLVNASREVWLDRGAGLERAAVNFSHESEVRHLAVRLAAAAGRRLDDAAPYVDVRLPGGVRMHAVLPPISPDGVLLSFRIPRMHPWSLDDFVAAGSIPPDAACLVRAIIASRLSFLITGGTGSGKTTLLATLLGCVDASERLVIVEDTGELQPAHSHVVRLEARSANSEGAGAVGLRILVREALRMRPDRLVVGEVRGGECVDLLAALNVGHKGAAGTLHANSVLDVPARVEALCAMAGLGREGTHSQLAAGLDVVLHMRRDDAGCRRLSCIGVLERDDRGWVQVVPAVHCAEGATTPGVGHALLDRLLGAA